MSTEPPAVLSTASLDSPPKGRVFAIIICINRYKARDGLLNLNGCVNDGRQFEDFLTKKLRVPDSHICWRTDENATYQEIMGLLKVASENLMALFPKASDFQKGDLIVLFYAGHGGRSRLNAPPLWAEGHVTDDGAIELLCPHDIDAQAEDHTKIHGIPDFVFGNLLEAIANKNGGNVLSILDCCHSGGIARDTEGNNITVRGIDCEPIDPAALQKLRSEYPKAVGMRGSLRSASDAQISVSFVLLAACRKHELSSESRAGPNDMTRGIFTNALINALDELLSYNLSYASLTERLARAVAAKTYTQTPECIGNSNRVLFSLNTTEGDARFELEKAHDGLYTILNAGEVQGILKGATFNVRSRDGDVILGTLEVVGSTDDRSSSYANPSFDPELDPKNLWAFLHKLSYSHSPLKVGLGSGVASFHLQQTTAVNETSVDAAEIVLSKGGYSWILERKEPKIVRECSSHITLPIHVQFSHLNHVLAGVAHFNYHLMRTNQFRSNEAITIEMYQVTKQSHNLFSPKDGNNLIKDSMANLVYDTYADANYGFTLKNNSSIDWYPYLFHFDPSDYSIYQIYPVPKQATYELSLAGLAFPIGHGESILKPTKFFLRNEESAKGFLKLFLSKTRIHMDFIGQSSPFTLDFRRHFDIYEEDDSQWMEKMVAVEIKKKWAASKPT